MDKAGKKYWNDSWAASAIPAAVNPRDGGRYNWVNQQFHRMFVDVFARNAPSGGKLLEIGCARSSWLPYFAKEFGFEVYGVDYSPIGAQMARDVLRASSVTGEVVCADLFAPPEALFGMFDVVVSFGVAEHFEDTAAYLRAVARFLKPGGLLITNIPNMVGAIGFIQKVINRPVYDIHQPIDLQMMRDAHVAAQMEVLECDYFMFTNFGVNNLTGISIRTPLGFVKKVLLALLARASILSWFVEGTLGAFPPNKFTSPYINCVARRC
jgi:2-polyprenyl-3-methyl-5-hydroxy-6-metoxy-1,4-benzoquinol methylase